MVASPYNFGVSTKLLVPVALDMNTVSYRSVHIQPARSVEEIMVDEIAKRLSKDPWRFASNTCAWSARKAVLQRGGGGGQLGQGDAGGLRAGRGRASGDRARSPPASSRSTRAMPRARQGHKATIAIDVGKPINPLGIEAQMQGGLADAIALVLTPACTSQDGLPLEGSYSQYHFTRMKDLSEGRAGHHHAGNAATRSAAWARWACRPRRGAIANAYARATGIKPRKLPAQLPGRLHAVPAGALPNPVVVPVLA